MRLPRVDQAIDSCGEHAKGTEIEAFLTRHLLVLTCAAFEQEIESLVVERASKSGDAELARVGDFSSITVGDIWIDIYRLLALDHDRTAIGKVHDDELVRH